MLGGFVSWQFKSFALEKDEHSEQMMLLTSSQTWILRGILLEFPSKTSDILPQQRFLWIFLVGLFWLLYINHPHTSLLQSRWLRSQFPYINTGYNWWWNITVDACCLCLDNFRLKNHQRLQSRYDSQSTDPKCSLISSYSRCAYFYTTM